MIILPLSLPLHHIHKSPSNIYYLAGVSYEGLRQKFQKLRKEQKDIYEKMGWTLSDSCPSSNGAEKTAMSEKATKGKKRSADGDADAEGEEAPEKPAKKARAKKQHAAEGEDGEAAAEKPVTKAKGRGRTKKGANADEVWEDNSPTNDLGGGVKEEVVDEI
jgi:hypothetical protein